MTSGRWNPTCLIGVNPPSLHLWGHHVTLQVCKPLAPLDTLTTAKRPPEVHESWFLASFCGVPKVTPTLLSSLCILLPFSGETTDPSLPDWRKCRTLNAHLVPFLKKKSRGIDVGVRENQRRARKLQRTHDWNEKTRKKVVQVKKRDQTALICL